MLSCVCLRFWLFILFICFLFFFFKQKTAYEMRISDWSSDVCSSDLRGAVADLRNQSGIVELAVGIDDEAGEPAEHRRRVQPPGQMAGHLGDADVPGDVARQRRLVEPRSEEHTSELQSLMRISYAVFCLKKNKQPIT